MKRHANNIIAAGIILLAALVYSQPASAAPQPSSDLLLPYFEVDLNGGLTTLFSVINAHQEPVPARISVFSNWGIEVLSEEITLDADEVKTINLADWIRSGNIPSNALRGAELNHLQAALTGQNSQKTGMFYSSEGAVDIAVGYIEIHILSTPRHDVLWGDYFVVDPLQDFAQGEILVNIDRTTECGALCARRALRFLTGGGFDGGTEIIIWTGRRGIPTADGYFDPNNATETSTAVYNEQGAHIDDRLLSLRSVEIVTVAELGLAEPFGWLDVQADRDFFMAVRYSANNRFSVGLVSHCLPITEVCTGPDCNPEPPCTENCGNPENPAIDIEKATNGHDADDAPGVTLDRDAAVTWTYVVTNTGDVQLSNVNVTDDDSSLNVSCPKDTLAVDEQMTCTAAGTASAKNYRNLGTAIGTSPEGQQVDDEDPSNYNTPDPEIPENPAIDIEKATNGHDADNAPGVTLDRDAAVTWTYVVTNTGDVQLSNVNVTDDDSSLNVSCPKDTLAVDEQMTCTAAGTASAKNYRNLGTAIGTSPKGQQVEDEDPSNYNTPDPEVPEECGACDGKITTLTLQFLGNTAAHVEVIAKRGGNGNDTVFSGNLNPGDTFTIIGPASGNGGFAGTLGTEARFYINGNYQTFLHTSCSAPVGPGTIAGSFLVIEGASKNGGNLCPM